MFEDLANQGVSIDLPLFISTNLFWGLGLVFLSIVFSAMSWRIMKHPTLRSLWTWLINLAIFIAGLIMITRAFPRMHGGLVLAIIFIIIIIAICGGTVVAKKKDNKGDKDGGDKDTGDKK